MSRRDALALMLLAVGACYAIDAPKDGIASLSFVLPYPAVVRGDTLRDSAGNVSPLRVVALGTRGDTIRRSAAFVVVDTPYRYLHVDGAGYVYGDSVRSVPVHILGSVGFLQTGPESVYVTVPPTRLAPSDTADSISFYGGPHSDSLAISTYGIAMRVIGAGDTAVAGFVVNYSITHSPIAAANRQSAVLIDDQNKPSLADTTNSAGVARRRVALNVRGLLVDSKNVPLSPIGDSVVVVAHVLYLHKDVLDSTGRPLTFVVHISR